MDEQQQYEAGMEEGEYLASETDERCAWCDKVLLGWEIEHNTCGDCFPPDEEDLTGYAFGHSPALVA